MSFLVYINSDCCNFHLNQIDKNISRTHNLTEYLDSTSNKIALLHVPYPYEVEFEELVIENIEHSDKVIILCSELHGTTVEFIKKFNHDKIFYFINGFIDNVQSYLWMDWFTTTTHVYKNTSILEQLTPHQVKDKYFDILLGQRREHRDLIYTKTKHLSSCNIITYLLNRDIPLQSQNSDGWVWESPGVILPQTEIGHSVATVTYYGHKISLSQVIPISIYNQTAYSVVAETNFDNRYSFFTEKIVKPILAKRLFIVFSGQNYLHNLRNLGFKTFDGIIDESYDVIVDPLMRFEAAVTQINYLIQQPQPLILTKLTPIVEYNYQVLMNTDWENKFLSELKALILS